MKKLVLTAAFVTLCAGHATSQEADLSYYAQSPAALSAIASAVSAAGGCSVPLVFDETVADGERYLGVHCRGTEDDEISIVIRFMDDGFTLLPLGFEYAG